MKKYMAICATLVALAWAGVAAAATPQGQLTGGAFVNSSGIIPWFVSSPVIDGGTSFVRRGERQVGQLQRRRRLYPS